MSPQRRRPPLAMVATCGLLGVLLAAQLNYQRRLSAAPRVGEARLEQVVQLYESQRAENDQLRRQLDEALASSGAGGSRQEVATEQHLAALGSFAGVAPVQGPGVRVVLTDSNGPGEGAGEQDALTVHDQDLLQVINELRAAGAEAIELNGQRLTAVSAVRCSGPVIQVNGSALAPPYRILAIGDPAALSGALLDLRGGILDQLRNVGIAVTVTREVNLQLPGLGREPSFRYARPAVPPTGGEPGS
ncbi:MAG: DUF881 domain-containing protein [Fimbriimonadaceae bacterium]|nr:DUF881 domain-containing protein [Fimbriimonadaceae bacterium]